MESYKHIELTEEEYAAAILLAKQQKEKRRQHAELMRRAEENRKSLTSMQWSYEQTKSFMLYRATQVFADKPFVIDQDNALLFELLCRYFSNDAQFEAIAENAGISDPSLNKGIMLAGVFGVGKTWMMKLFQKNQRQVFFIRNAKALADEYQQDGVSAAEQYENKFKNPVNDAMVFFQPYSGLCIDDIGSEDVKKHFGNQRNVIGDLIELRYSKGNTGPFLHATTNLSTDQIEQYYGGRVRSRMREIFNLIELPGSDRRK